MTLQSFSMRRRAGLLALIMSLAVSACREADQPVGPGANARVEVTSDPAGAQIYLDGNNTGKVTPDLLRDLIGLHEVLVRMDRDNITYGFRTQVDVKGDSLHKIYGPLTMRCTTATCGVTSQKYHTLGTMRVSSNPNGALFYYDGTNKGLLYPSGFPNGFIAMGMPMISMIAGARDTLSMGIYALRYLAGRPSPSVTTTADRYMMQQQTWLVPPTEVIVTGQPTVRGIQIDEELIGMNATNDVAFIKLTYTNITNKASYQAADPIVLPNGIKFDSVYIGFAVDADIGSEADDLITYDPTQDMVFAYDADFSEPIFSSNDSEKPALVGLKILSVAHANRILNGWPTANDFAAGDATERFGWGILSGRKSYAPDYAGTQIGHVPTAPGDYRMSVSAGPFTLAVGESASMVVAVVMAQPVPGTYVPGAVVQPGDPLDPNRTIARIAKTLLDRARGLTVP